MRRANFPNLSFSRSRWAWLFGASSPRWAAKLAVLCLALSVVLLGCLAWRWLMLRQQLMQAQHSLAVAQEDLGTNARARPVSKQAPILAADATRVNQVVRRLNTPWPSLFGALEKANAPEMALLSVEPDVERGAIRIQTQARALDALLNHAQRLQEHGEFAQVQLLRIETEQSAAGGSGSAPRLTFDVVLAR